MALQEGKKAPSFTAKDQDGESIKLSDFKGKKLALYFYPKDDTSTCTVQACNIRDGFKMLAKKGIEVIGVSPDDEKSHTKLLQVLDYSSHSISPCLMDSVMLCWISSSPCILVCKTVASKMI